MSNADGSDALRDGGEDMLLEEDSGFGQRGEGTRQDTGEKDERGSRGRHHRSLPTILTLSLPKMPLLPTSLRRPSSISPRVLSTPLTTLWATVGASHHQL